LRSRLFAAGQDLKFRHGTAHRTSREDRSEAPIDRPCRCGPRKPTPEPRPACGPTYSARGTPELEHDSVTCTPYKSSKTARWSSGTPQPAAGLLSPRYSARMPFIGRSRFPACPSFVNLALVPFRVLRVRQSAESHRRSRSTCSILCGAGTVSLPCPVYSTLNPKQFSMADSHRTPVPRPASVPYQDRAAHRSSGDQSGRGVYGRLSPPPGALMRRSDAGPVPKNDPTALIPDAIFRTSSGLLPQRTPTGGQLRRLRGRPRT
jgi:hypothetical protein